MKKLNKKVNNVLYALVFELVLIPLLGYISYFIYNKFMLFSFMDNSLFLDVLLIVILIGLNLVAIYYIAYALTHVYKFELEYQVVVGIIIVFIAVWFKLYYNALETTTCGINSYSECLSIMKNNQTFSTIIIFVVAYNLLYIPMHKINKRKGKKVKVKI